MQYILKYKKINKASITNHTEKTKTGKNGYSETSRKIA